jgi:hypothetical protein
VRLAGLLCLCGFALAALAPAAAAAPQQVPFAKAKLEADREAKQLCQIVPGGCSEHAARCARLSPRKVRCHLVAREGPKTGDLVYTATMLYYRTSRGKFVKEQVDVDKFRIGEPRPQD